MSHLVDNTVDSRRNNIDLKLKKLLNDIGVICINSDEIKSCDDLAKKYKKKDYDKLIHVAYTMYAVLGDAIPTIVEARSSLTSTTSESKEQSDRSLPTTGTVSEKIIEEIRQNREEIQILKEDLVKKSDSESAQFKSYAETVRKNVAEMGKQVAAKTQTKKMVKSLVTELKKNDRKNNVIAYGVNPQNCGKALFKDAFSDIGFRGVSFDLEPIGESKEGKSRPIRVRFSHESTVKSILRHAHLLKTVGYMTICIWRLTEPTRSD